MKNVYTFALLLLMSLMLVGCGGHQPSITLRVLDEQTKQPIEGAYAIAWWYDVHGLPGLTYHKLAELAEDVSDKDGHIKLPPFSTSSMPHIKVFKPGYVGWWNFKIYKGHWENDIRYASKEKREGFVYVSQDIYLEKWKDEYSYSSHLSFLNEYVPTSPGYPLEFDQAIDDYFSSSTEYTQEYEMNRRSLRNKQ